MILTACPPPGERNGHVSEACQVAITDMMAEAQSGTHVLTSYHVRHSTGCARGPRTSERGHKNVRPTGLLTLMGYTARGASARRRWRGSSVPGSALCQAQTATGETGVATLPEPLTLPPHCKCRSPLHLKRSFQPLRLDHGSNPRSAECSAKA